MEGITIGALCGLALASLIVFWANDDVCNEARIIRIIALVAFFVSAGALIGAALGMMKI